LRGDLHRIERDPIPQVARGKRIVRIARAAGMQANLTASLILYAALQRNKILRRGIFSGQTTTDLPASFWTTWFPKIIWCGRSTLSIRPGFAMN
jgi:hypothetical protein